MEHPIIVLAAALALAAPAAAETALKCEQFTPPARTVKTSRMQALRRGKAWTEGPAQSAADVACDVRGMKTVESEYDGKALRLRTAYAYREGDEAKAFRKAGKWAELKERLVGLSHYLGDEANKSLQR